MVTDDKFRSDGNRLLLGCQCGACSLPFGYVQNGVLIIMSKHNGEAHINVLTIDELGRLLEVSRHKL